MFDERPPHSPWRTSSRSARHDSVCISHGGPAVRRLRSGRFASSTRAFSTVLSLGRRLRMVGLGRTIDAISSVEAEVASREAACSASGVTVSVPAMLALW